MIGIFLRMVPTTVELLREGQGVLERVLRSIKMEHIYKRSDSTEKESGMKNTHSKIPNDCLFLFWSQFLFCVLQKQIVMRCRQYPWFLP